MGEEVVAMTRIKKVMGGSRGKEKRKKCKRNGILSSSSRHPCLGILWELKRTEGHGRRDAGMRKPLSRDVLIDYREGRTIGGIDIVFHTIKSFI